MHGKPKAAVPTELIGLPLSKGFDTVRELVTTELHVVTADPTDIQGVVGVVVDVVVVVPA